MSTKHSTGRAHNWDQDRLNRINAAKLSSELTFARVTGMRARARLAPPQAATGGFPYAARTCAEWTALDAKRARQAEGQ